MIHQQTDLRTEEASGARLTSMRGLLLMNAALLLVLGAVTFGSSAEAQQRATGEFTMVSGGAPGSEGDVVYVVDTVNEELIAVRYDTTTKRIIGVGYRNLVADAATRLAPGRSR